MAESWAAAELLTTRNGLIFVQDFGITHLEVETDAQALETMLENLENFPNHELAVIIRDIGALLKKY